MLKSLMYPSNATPTFDSMEEIEEPSFWEKLRDQIAGGFSALFSLLGIGYLISAGIMGNYYACTDKENSSYQYSLFQGAIWPYHVFINPEWKKVWDERTHALGVILIVQMGGSDELSTKISIGEVTPFLKKWAADLPKNKRVMLEKSAIALCQATNEYQRRATRKLLQSGRIQPISEEGVLRELVDELSNVPVFKRLYADQKATFKELMEELVSELPGAPSIDPSTGMPTKENSNRQTANFEAMLKDPIYQLAANEAWQRSFREEETHRRRTSMILKDIFGPSSGLPKSVFDKSNLFE